MKKKIIVLPVAILILSVLLVPTFADVGKGESMNKYDGEWRYMPQSMDPLVTNNYGSQFALSADSAEWTGALEGESHDDCVSVLHAAGRWFGYCTASFASVTIDGQTGGLELGITLLKTAPTDPWVGEWFITSGSGDLEGLEGEGSIWGHGYNPEKPDEPGIIYYKVKKLKE
jgi:hypothetical protein